VLNCIEIGPVGRRRKAIVIIQGIHSVGDGIRLLQIENEFEGI
jgi:hypothetical protein